MSVPHTVCITGINYILKYIKTETSILNNNLIFHNITVYINCQDVSTAVNPIYLSHIYIYIYIMCIYIYIYYNNISCVCNISVFIHICLFSLLIIMYSNYLCIFFIQIYIDIFFCSLSPLLDVTRALGIIRVKNHNLPDPDWI